MKRESLIKTIKSVAKEKALSETTRSRYAGRQHQSGRYSASRKLAQEKVQDEKNVPNGEVNMEPTLNTINQTR